MVIHYKFKSALEYDTLPFDGLNISVSDLKKAIIEQKKLAKNGQFHLSITDAQTKQAYINDSDLIPRNASVIITRVPISTPKKTSKIVEDALNARSSGIPSKSGPSTSGSINVAGDLFAKPKLSGESEDDRIHAAISQSTKDYHPSNYVKTRNMPTGKPPQSYLCFRCRKPGHYVQNCPMNAPLDPDAPEPQVDNRRVKRNTGIPLSFLTLVDDPNAPGALMVGDGKFAVPKIDKEAYERGKKERPPFLPQEEQPVEQKVQIPGTFVCPICKEVMKDAVVIPCCGTSFCDECVRNALLESSTKTCPMDFCGEQEVSPLMLIPNQCLRKAIIEFQNNIGKVKMVPTQQVVLPSMKILDSVTTSAGLAQVPEPERPVVKASSLPSNIPADLIGLPPQVIASQLRLRREGGPGPSNSPSSVRSDSPDIPPGEDYLSPSKQPRPPPSVPQFNNPPPQGLHPPPQQHNNSPSYAMGPFNPGMHGGPPQHHGCAPQPQHQPQMMMQNMGQMQHGGAPMVHLHGMGQGPVFTSAGSFLTLQQVGPSPAGGHMLVPQFRMQQPPMQQMMQQHQQPQQIMMNVQQPPPMIHSQQPLMPSGPQPMMLVASGPRQGMAGPSLQQRPPMQNQQMAPFGSMGPSGSGPPRTFNMPPPPIQSLAQVIVQPRATPPPPLPAFRPNPGPSKGPPRGQMGMTNRPAHQGMSMHGHFPRPSQYRTQDRITTMTQEEFQREKEKIMEETRRKIGRSADLWDDFISGDKRSKDRRGKQAKSQLSPKRRSVSPKRWSPGRRSPSRRSRSPKRRSRSPKRRSWDRSLSRSPQRSPFTKKSHYSPDRRSRSRTPPSKVPPKVRQSSVSPRPKPRSLTPPPVRTAASALEKPASKSSPVRSSKSSPVRSRQDIRSPPVRPKNISKSPPPAPSKQRSASPPTKEIKPAVPPVSRSPPPPPAPAIKAEPRSPPAVAKASTKSSHLARQEVEASASSKKEPWSPPKTAPKQLSPGPTKKRAESPPHKARELARSPVARSRMSPPHKERVYAETSKGHRAHSPPGERWPTEHPEYRSTKGLSPGRMEYRPSKVMSPGRMEYRSTKTSWKRDRSPSPRSFYSPSLDAKNYAADPYRPRSPRYRSRSRSPYHRPASPTYHSSRHHDPPSPRQVAEMYYRQYDMPHDPRGTHTGHRSFVLDPDYIRRAWEDYFRRTGNEHMIHWSGERSSPPPYYSSRHRHHCEDEDLRYPSETYAPPRLQDEDLRREGGASRAEGGASRSEGGVSRVEVAVSRSKRGDVDQRYEEEPAPPGQEQVKVKDSSKEQEEEARQKEEERKREKKDRKEKKRKEKEERKKEKKEKRRIRKERQEQDTRTVQVGPAKTEQVRKEVEVAVEKKKVEEKTAEKAVEEETIVKEQEEQVDSSTADAVLDQPEIIIKVPELSKWERDSESDHEIEAPKKKETRKPLPRSVIESAEKVLTSKPPRGAILPSTLVTGVSRKVYIEPHHAVPTVVAVVKPSVHDRLGKRVEPPADSKDRKHRSEKRKSTDVPEDVREVSGERKKIKLNRNFRRSEEDKEEKASEERRSRHKEKKHKKHKEHKKRKD